MASTKHAWKWLAVLSILLAVGCTGPGQVSLWPFWAHAPSGHFYRSDASESLVDKIPAQKTPAKVNADGVRQASAQESLDPPGEATATEGDAVIYADPVVPSTHRVR